MQENQPESLENQILDLIAQTDPKAFWEGIAQIAEKIFNVHGCYILTQANPDAPWQQLTQVGNLSDENEATILALAERAVRTQDLEQIENLSSHLAFVLNQPNEVRKIVMLLVGDTPTLLSTDEKAGYEVHVSILRGAFLQHSQPHNRVDSALKKQIPEQISQLNELLLDSPNLKHSYLLIANQFASLFNASQVSLGQLKNNRIKLQAVSGRHHYNAQSEWADMIENLMEECLDQVSPLLANSTTTDATEHATTESELILVQHQAYQRLYDNPHLLTLAFTHANESFAFICLERKDSSWSATDIDCSKGLIEAVSGSLYNNTQKYAPLLPRLSRKFESKVNQFVRIEKLWAKLFGVTLLATFILCCVIKVPYRITGNFVIEAENQTQISALRDGTLQEVFIREGDQVEAGEILAKLDDIDLRLQQAELNADHARAKAQMEAAMSIGEFAQARIAEAEVSSIEAQLEWTEINIQAGQIFASSSGILLADEELSRRIGSPIRKGEVLLVLALPQSWQAVIEIDEAEINHLPQNSRGEIAFVSRPSESLEDSVTRTETMARSRPSGSIFRVFSEIEQQQEIWWKPGMTGVAKLDAGKHTLMWIWTHRLVDWLRLKLWF